MDCSLFLFGAADNPTYGVESRRLPGKYAEKMGVEVSDGHLHGVAVVAARGISFHFVLVSYDCLHDSRHFVMKHVFFGTITTRLRWIINTR